MGGTTEEMMIPLTSAASTLPMSKRLRKRTPYSSTVWVMTVATRQCASRRGGELLPAKPGATVSYTPSTVLVLPTSRTRSIVTPCSRPHASGNNDPQPFVGTNAQEAAGIKSIGHAIVAAIFIHMDLLAMAIRRARLHAPYDGLKTQRRSADRAAHGAKQGAILTIKRADERRRHFQTGKFLARLKAHGGSRAGQVRR